MKLLPLTLVVASVGPSLTLFAWQSSHESSLQRLSSSLSTSASSSMASPSRTIRVSGEAVINVVPDLARFNVFVESRAADRTRALAAADERVAAVLTALTAAGIEKKDITTATASLSPEYGKNARGELNYLNVVGWTAHRSITICSHHIETLGQVQQAAVAAGAFPEGEIAFDTTRLAELSNDARTKAAQAAKKKAETLLHELGGSLGLPLSVDESASSWSGAYTTKNSVENLAEGAVVEAAFAAGKLSINANVNVTFEVDG